MQQRWQADARDPGAGEEQEERGHHLSRNPNARVDAPAAFPLILSSCHAPPPTPSLCPSLRWRAASAG
eukprot:scaffold140041_cov28-Tisochrysis_lutea.AAC.1